MKNFRSVMLIAALVTCISCSDNDNDPEVNSGMILGEWQLEEMNYSGTTSMTMEGQTSSLVYAAEAIDIDAQVIFNDQTYRSQGSYTIRMSTTMEGNTQVQDYPFSDISGTGTYNIEGNRITTDPDLPPGSEQEFLMEGGEGTIMELKENRMVIVNSEEVTSIVNGMEMEVTMELIQIFSR